MRNLPMGLEEQDIPMLTKMILNNGRDKFPFSDGHNIYGIEFSQLVRLLHYNYLKQSYYQYLQVTERTFEALKDG